MASKPSISATSDGVRFTLDHIDQTLVESYADLIRRTSIHGETYAVYVHRLGDPLPPLSFDYSDDSTVCSSVVLKLDEQNWAFISNAKVGIKNPHINLYCSSKIQFIYPLEDDLKQFLRHFFPTKHTLNIHHSMDSNSLDKNGCLTAMLNLYCSIIADRTLKFNVMLTSNITEQIITAIIRSVKEKTLLRFTDNECFSIFIPTYDISPDHSYSIRFVTWEELEEYRLYKSEQIQPVIKSKRQVSSELLSDDDFEKTPPFRSNEKTKKSESTEDDIPRFVEPSEADRAQSKSRLNGIKRLVQEQSCHNAQNDNSIINEPIHTSSASVESTTAAQRSEDSGADFDRGHPAEPSLAQPLGVDNTAKPSATPSLRTDTAAHSPKSVAVSSDSPSQSTEDPCTVLLRDHPVAPGPFGTISHLENSYKSADNVGLNMYKRQMVCRHSDCIKTKGNVSRKLHYHCLMCKTHMSKEFKRVIAHMLKCPLASKFAEAASTRSTDSRQDSEPGTDAPNESNSSSTVKTAQHNSNTPKDKAAEQKSSSNQSVETAQHSNSSLNVETARTNNSSEETGRNSVSPDDDLTVCWDTGPTCKIIPPRAKTKHLHCKLCDISHTSHKRMIEHIQKCKEKNSTISGNTAVEKTRVAKDSNRTLQAELICPISGTYLVRRGTQGPAAPVHVRVHKKGWECTVTSCKDMYNFHGGSLNPSYLCDHALACLNQNLTTKPDLINDSVNFDGFGEDDKLALLSFCKDAKEFGAPVIKQFHPIMADSLKTSRYIYYGVFAGTGTLKYYSLLRRVLVTYDRNTKTHKCECSVRSCIHKKIAVLVSEINPDIQKERPEDQVDQEEIKTAKMHMQYVLEHKQFPFDVSKYTDTVEVTEFAPHETHCHKCDDVELSVLSVHQHGIIFSIDKKVTGVKVVTKHCPSCKFQLPLLRAY